MRVIMTTLFAIHTYAHTCMHAKAHTEVTYNPKAKIMWCAVCFEFRDVISSTDVAMIEGTDSFRIENVNRHAKSKIHEIAVSFKKAK